MTDCFQNQKIGVLVKTTLVDYPGNMASALFLKGCNLRCPYCYNVELVASGTSSDGIPFLQDAVSFCDVIAHLKKRKNVLRGFVISGGEALLYPHLAELVKEARNLGYKIKIDTNGTLPEKLEEILLSPELCPDFVALDIKTRPSYYGSLSGKNTDTETAAKLEQNLLKSIRLVASLPPEKREFRTVLVPGLIDNDVVKEIAELLPADASWNFANFVNKSCLEPEFEKIHPFAPFQIEEILENAKKIIPGAVLR